MIKDLRDARLVDAVPRVVAGQDWVRALSEAVGVLHERTLRYIDDSQIYTSLDTATEPVLDALAINWKVDWYDTGYSVEQKLHRTAEADTGSADIGEEETQCEPIST